MLGVGGGLDASGLTDDSTRNAALMAGGLTLPWTNAGRKAIQTALVRRPQAMRNAGDVLDQDWVRRIAGLIGAPMLPYNTTEGY
jgi:hypothetical protein